MRETATTCSLPDILLGWYDAHARIMPWRVPPADRAAGVQPDPYRIWLSEVMLQQTTVATVREYFQRFTTRWPTVGDLAAAPDADVMGEWAGLGYYARARNLLKCARVVVEQHDGQFPADYATLLKLPGIGPYTASAVSSIAFDLPYTVLDGNVERVMARLYDIHTPLPAAKPELMVKAQALTPPYRPGDYAQAIMDLGATICTPKSPACEICPWRDPCLAPSVGQQPNYPRNSPRRPSPSAMALFILRAAKTGPGCLKLAPTRVCWVVCWAGPVQLGSTRMIPALLAKPL